VSPAQASPRSWRSERAILWPAASLSSSSPIGPMSASRSMPYSPAEAAQLRRSVHSWIFAAPRHLGTGPANRVSAPTTAIQDRHRDSARLAVDGRPAHRSSGGAASLRGRRCRLRRAIRRQFVCAAQARQRRFLAERGGRIIVPTATHICRFHLRRRAKWGSNL
jgi:hypothetical protein